MSSVDERNKAVNLKSSVWAGRHQQRMSNCSAGTCSLQYGRKSLKKKCTLGKTEEDVKARKLRCSFESKKQLLSFIHVVRVVHECMDEILPSVSLNVFFLHGRPQNFNNCSSLTDFISLDHLMDCCSQYPQKRTSLNTVNSVKA